jgi:hypothetical protein
VARDPIGSALQELILARKLVSKSGHRQVRRQEDRDSLSAVAYAWFKSHRKDIVARADTALLKKADDAYRVILDATAKSSAQSTFLDAIADAKVALVGLRSHIVVNEANDTEPETTPNFSPLASDQVMRGILERRWHECQKCLGAGADLAAIVMMGGLLEALFVARANKLPNKSVLFKMKSVPLDSKTKKPLDLRDWTLGPYIDVGYEMEWIRKSGKEVAAVLRDYRNYVHPEKERSHRITLNAEDSSMLWGVTKGLVHQLLASAKREVT